MAHENPASSESLQVKTIYTDRGWGNSDLYAFTTVSASLALEIKTIFIFKKK